MESSKKQRLCVVGGGPTGIISCKLGLEYNFDVTLYEKESEIFGNWNVNQSNVWDDLITNISKYTTQFSDYVWSNVSSIYPNKKEMNFFLKKFVDDFGLEKCVQKNSEVVNVELIENGKIRVSILSKEDKINVKTDIFDYILICSGNYSIPNMIGLKNIQGSELEIIHSSNYKNSYEFRGKRVMVVGNGNSGVEICSEVCKSSKSLVNVYISPSWILPKGIYSEFYGKYIPFELTLFTRKNLSFLSQISREEKTKFTNMFFSQLSNQNEINEKLYIKLEENAQAAISVSYLTDVKKKLIQLEIGTISKIEGKKVTLSNGTSFEIDTIILCTGYKRDYSFLDKKTLDIIEYKKTKNPLGVNLYKNLIHPKLNNIAFIALTQGHFMLWELQVRFALSYFKGKIIIENNDYFNESIQHLKNKVGYVEAIAGELGLIPNLDKVKEFDEELYDNLLNGPLLPQHYSLGDFSTKLNKMSVEYIKSVNRDLKKPFMVTKF